MTGEGDKIAWILADDECGQFDVVTEDEIERAVARHFFWQHRRAGVLVEGRDWRRIPPVARCDLCGTPAELPWWEHTATPRLAEANDLDGRWLVCDLCHELVLAKHVDALVERAWTQSRRAAPWVSRPPHGGLVKTALRQQMVLAVERFDAGIREAV